MSAAQRARSREAARHAAVSAMATARNTDTLMRGTPNGALSAVLVEVVSDLAHAVEILADVSEAQEGGGQ